jgi:hypothetical protein
VLANQERIGLALLRARRAASQWRGCRASALSFHVTGTSHREIVFSCGWSVSRGTAIGEPIVRSSHMYVGQEVQAGTIRRELPPNQCLQATANLTPRRRYGRQFHCRPALRRPTLSMPRLSPALGTRSPPLASYLAQCAQRRMRGLAVPRSRASSSRCSRQSYDALVAACQHWRSQASHPSIQETSVD